MEFQPSNLPGHEGRLGLYMHTFTGKKYFPCDPRAEEVDIIDIAHHLANQCRFAGATTRFLSVAEHSVFCSLIDAPPQDQLEALMHDAAEAYMQDMIRPLKYLPQMKPVYQALEALNEEVIAKKFGLRYPWSPHVKRCDELACNVEMRDLIKAEEKGFIHEKMAIPENLELLDLTNVQAEQRFLNRFEFLTFQCKALKNSHWIT